MSEVCGMCGSRCGVDVVREVVLMDVQRSVVVVEARKKEVGSWKEKRKR